jgi:two-component system cell cycle sensor histidine kinase/response regulator CckA
MTRVLVVDDHPVNLDYLSALLRLQGWEVASARHGAEALTVARQILPELIVSDLLMPVMDGYTLLRFWKTDPKLRNVPFVVYTATYTEPEDERLALQLGADAFILKPAEPDVFVARLREVLEVTRTSSVALPAIPPEEDNALLKQYSETLIRKLEQKSLQLEEANRVLQLDIQERIKVEHLLRASEAELRQWTEVMPQIVWVTRPDGWHIHFNQRWMDYTGLTLEESLGHGWLPPFHPEDRPLAAERWARATGSGEPYEIEYRLRGRDGTYRWMLGRAMPLRDLSGAIIKWFGTCTDIHALKQAEERANLVRMAGSLSRVGGWTIELPERSVTWSDERRAIHEASAGFTPTFEDVISYYLPEHRDQVRRAFEACITDGTPFEFELPMNTAAGRRVWVRSIGEAMRDAAGRIVRVQGALQDISERKRSEDALRASESELRGLAESMPQMVWMTDAEGLAIYLNQRWVDYTGSSLEASYGHGWSKPFHPDDRTRAEEAWRRAVAGLADYNLECRIRGRDGLYRWMLIRGLPFRDESGTILKWMGTCTDIHDLKEANRRLREQASLLDLANDAILVRDLQHRVLYWNQSAERVYGWSAAEALGRSVTDLIYRDPAPFLAAVDAALANGEWIGEIDQYTREGKRLTAEGHWTLVRDEDGNPRSILAINNDVSARKQLELQSLRSQRLESIGTLAGGIAHDFNNLLAPIFMGVSFLQRVETRENVLAVVRNIDRSAKRGKELVRQVLSFARGVDGNRVALDLGHIVREVELILRSTFPKNIALRLDVAKNLFLVDADPTQLQQVLMNLCVNARDAMPDGGRLTIWARNTIVDESTATRHQDVKPGPYVEVRVSDDGTGMAREVLDRIFEPFFTTKAVGKGTGLGLSTVLGIVRGHRGLLDVESEVGQGTTFKVFFRAHGEAVSQLPPQKDAEVVAGRGELILLVDDEAPVLTVTAQTLESFGYRTLSAEDGATALAIYAKHGEGIAAVVTDIMMPGMTGLMLSAELQRINPNVLVIAASGVPPDGADDPAGLGIKAFLQKPYAAEDLLAVLRSVLPPPE